MIKDQSILLLVEKLACDLKGKFVIIDYWEGDLCAIGFANPIKQSNLVYVSTYFKEDGNFYVETEVPDTNCEFEYKTECVWNNANYYELRRIINKHLFEN